MAYATIDDLALRLGPVRYVQLTDDEGTGNPNVPRAAEALAAGEAEVDSRLAARYRTPVDVSTEPQAAALLKGLALDLAEYRLHARQPPVPEDIRLKATAARQWLADLVAGRAHLPLLQPAPGNTSRGLAADTSGPSRVFRREEESGSGSGVSGLG